MWLLERLKEVYWCILVTHIHKSEQSDESTSIEVAGKLSGYRVALDEYLIRYMVLERRRLRLRLAAKKAGIPADLSVSWEVRLNEIRVAV